MACRILFQIVQAHAIDRDELAFRRMVALRAPRHQAARKCRQGDRATATAKFVPSPRRVYRSSHHWAMRGGLTSSYALTLEWVRGLARPRRLFFPAWRAIPSGPAALPSSSGFAGSSGISPCGCGSLR